MTLQEYLTKHRLSYTEFSYVIRKTSQYVSLICKGERKPSFGLACEIEQQTLGEVSREEWYPSKATQQRRKEESERDV